MAMRGVDKQNSITTTSAMLGVFHADARTRNEFLQLIRNAGPMSPVPQSMSVGMDCVTD